MGVSAYPDRGLLKVKAAVVLEAQEDGIVPLRFRLREAFEVEKITQDGQELVFTRDGWDVTVEGVKVGADSTPLTWQYGGVFAPPYKSDSMEDVIVYPDEIRLTKTSHWYPEPRWRSRHPARPSSKISVAVPQGFVVVSGDHQEQKPEHRADRVLYRYASPTDGSLSFVAARFARTIVPWGDKTLEAYYFPSEAGDKPKLIVTKLPQDEEDVRETLQVARDILDFYSQTFCAYPLRKFSLVQKSSHVAYAYGVQTYVVMNDLSDAWAKSLAHEIAHQWWGNLIHPVGKGERWLTESLAEYSAFLYMEHAHGSKKVVGDHREFLLSEMRHSDPIRKTSFDTPNYGNIIYHIAPHVFHMLRYVLGDAEFSSTMKSFAEKHAWRNATVDDLINIAESIHGKPLGWFFDQWLDRTKDPEYVLDYEVVPKGNSTYTVRGKVKQYVTDYRMPLRIDIIGKDRKQTQSIWVDGAETPFTYTVDYQPSQVKFAEEMEFWVLAHFFDSERERLAAPKPAPPREPTADWAEYIREIREKVVVKRSYDLGTEVQLLLAPDQAAQLVCGDNPFGLEEYLIFCSDRGIIEFRRVFTGRDGRSGVGKVIQQRKFSAGPGRAPNLRENATWDIEDDKLRINFETRILTAEELKEFRKKVRQRSSAQRAK